MGYTKNWFAKFLVAMCVVSAAISSCTDDQCEGNQSVVPIAGLYTKDKAAISMDSLTIYGIDAPGDSVLQDNKTISQVRLPFRSTVGTTKYVIRYNKQQFAKFKMADTITFIYDPIPYFHSKECGAFYKYRLNDIKYTTYLVDSVGSETTEFTNTKDFVGIKIFYRASN